MPLARMGREHVTEVALLHCKSLTGLLSVLGLSAARAYYRGSVQSDWGIGFVCLNGGGVHGFVLGSINPSRLRREVWLRNFRETLWSLSIGIIKRPSAMLALCQSFRVCGRGRNDRSPELIYLAVDEASTEAGIGAQLVGAFNQALRDRGINAYELSVDVDNSRGIRFYEKLGFRPLDEYWQFGILRRRYRLEWEPTGLRSPVSASGNDD